MSEQYRGYTIREQTLVQDLGPMRAGSTVYPVSRPDGSRLGVYASRQMAHICITVELDGEVPDFGPNSGPPELRANA